MNDNDDIITIDASLGADENCNGTDSDCNDNDVDCEVDCQSET